MINNKWRNKRNGFIAFITLIISFLGIWIGPFSNGPKDQSINGNNNNQTMGNNSPVTICNNCTYLDSKDPNYLNPRSEFLQGKEPLALASLFLELQNQSKYRDACSLLTKRKGNYGCNVVDGEQVSDFARWSKKLFNGYESIEVKNNEINSEYKKTICVKYSYRLKVDTDPRYTTEIMAYYFDKREDGEREISSRVCEYKQKGNEKRDCPISTANKVCIGLF